MAKYDVTYECGHSDRIQLFGKHSLREWRLAREEEKLCPECWKVEFEKKCAAETAAAAQAAQEQELPQLVGSEKQIAWAETIRQKFFAKVASLLPELNPERYPREKVVGVIDSFHLESSARWWIDNRDERAERLIQRKIKELSENLPDPIPAPIIQEAKVEATVRPEKPLTETVAEIKPLEDRLEVHFPERHENFRELMHQNRFQWKDSCWQRDIGVTTGIATDRAANIGNTLLLKGFIIRIYDEKIRQAAISGTFEPECDRWITTNKNFPGKFCIRWWEKNQRLYDAARKLPRSKWDKPYIIVSSIYFAEVEDFARLYNFQFSPKAKELIIQARTENAATLTVTAIKPEIHGLNNPDIPTLKPEEFEVDETLCDND